MPVIGVAGLRREEGGARRAYTCQVRLPALRGKASGRWQDELWVYSGVVTQGDQATRRVIVVEEGLNVAASDLECSGEGAVFAPPMEVMVMA
ncbi:hypothetical protein E2C01_004245 [Portunus trituberculatus]|uniref:Uncharacterized protein n=1 Tax=Portunus trituberculatus TaxID=210409 RepID=A0A5B7CR46_PORTR|nr:hypothetical protein [Portunus trituberculatus]